MPSSNEPAEAVAVGRFLVAVVVILVIAVLDYLNKNNDQSSKAEIDVHVADVDVLNHNDADNIDNNNGQAAKDDFSDSISNTCANCGKEGSDVTNTCNKCKSVMYCNASCKKKHRHKHKKKCEEHLLRAVERAAELHDVQLFKQPPPQFEDCPICYLRTPMLGTGRTYMACCGKIICRGCIYAVQSRAASQKEDVCPFCRTPPAGSKKELIRRLEKRMEMNDGRAIYSLGVHYFNGVFWLSQNYSKAAELFYQAGKLGDADAYYGIGNAYKFGDGVEVDEKKAIHYWELAAIGGSSIARYNLGVYERKASNMDRAIKHYMIAAQDGYCHALESIKRMYANEEATKSDYATALQSYQAYLDEIKSDQRDDAAAFKDKYKYYECVFS